MTGTGVSEDVSVGGEAPSRRWSGGAPLRRVVGFLMLIVAAFAVIVIPQVLSAGVTGSPSGLPFPDPPSTGSCVVVESTVVTEVPCDQRHDGEVAKSWRADESPVPTFVLNRNYSMVAIDGEGGLLVSDPLCSGWGTQYVGTIKKFGPTLWSPVDPSYYTLTVAAPPGFGTDSRYWVACVVMPGAQVEYTGSVQDTGGATGSPRPDAFGWCFPTGGSSPDRAVYTNCAEPHVIEQLATFIPTQQMFYANTITVETSQSEIDEKCNLLAAQMMGTTDPTFGGRLEILTAPVPDVLSAGSDAQAGNARSGLIIPDCLVRYLGPGELTGTVVGVGDGPLPVA